MAAVLARGTTVVENAAREPEIGDLVDMLVAMGARIDGRGSSTLEVHGVDALVPVEHTTVGDRIEAGTFLVAGALAGGPVTVLGFNPAHLEMLFTKMTQAGCDFDLLADGATVRRTGPVRPVDVATLPYPGFPTDMQAQFMALAALAEGNSVITENVFENRFMFADEIKRMGADIDIEGHRALVRGVRALEGAPVRSPDLRGGAALVLAALVAEGRTVISDVHHIMRGYEDFTGKLAALGADIAFVED
jgi:UDP-N-acetylglucosamine 1-carboxyvinyltransferase